MREGGLDDVELVDLDAEGGERLARGGVVRRDDRDPPALSARGAGDVLDIHAALSERHELFDDRPQILGLGQRRRDLFMLDQGRRHVGPQRLAVLCRAVELAVGFAVTHVRYLRYQVSGVRYQAGVRYRQSS